MVSNGQPASLLSGKCILLIDDDRATSKLIAVLLRGEGCHVQTGADAATALRLLLAGLSTSLILLDLQLPDMSGLDLARFLKTCPVTSDVPIIAISASGPYYSEAAARAAGCDGFIAKPIDGDTFSEQVTSHLARRNP